MLPKEKILSRLWLDYTAQNPAAQKVYDLFRAEGETVENDHIAFRTFDDKRVDIDKLSRVFIRAGYHEKGSYEFEQKKLFAKHFEHQADASAPMVFISQLKTAEFSPLLQQKVKEMIEQIPTDLLNSEELIFSGTSWKTPHFSVYEQLRKESEYAAWLYVYGFRANHFTVSINALKKYNSIEKVNQFLKANGFILNASGGEIKGTPEELLQQSSIMAEKIVYDFADGKFEIPACYYEFALRHPNANGQLYKGFIAKSADKIFESTNYYSQTK